MPLPHILYPALKSILVNRLQKILYYSGKFQQFLELTSFTATSDHGAECDRTNLSQTALIESSLHRVQKDGQIWYVSAAAFKLTASTQKPTIELASKITDILNRDLLSLTLNTELTRELQCFDSVWHNFTVQAHAPGWIHLELSDIGLEEWLNLLCDRLPLMETLTETELETAQNQQAQPHAASAIISQISPENPIAQSAIGPVTVLYTHARCCSLLQLGVREQLIQLKPTSLHASLKASPWGLSHPHPIAWLTADRQFRCAHATEQRLIAQVIDVLDTLGSTTPALSPERLWLLADRLSQRFQAFDAYCRIFGAIKTTDRPLAQARLGLVFITQVLLYRLLRDHLHITPPIEL